MKKCCFLFAVLILLSTGIRAQHGKVIDRIIETGTTDNRTMQHLDVISNRFGGRLVGSDAYENAALWCASEFRKWGMDVIMDEAGSVPVGFNRGMINSLNTPENESEGSCLPNQVVQAF